MNYIVGSVPKMFFQGQFQLAQLAAILVLCHAFSERWQGYMHQLFNDGYSIGKVEMETVNMEEEERVAKRRIAEINAQKMLSLQQFVENTQVGLASVIE